MKSFGKVLLFGVLALSLTACLAGSREASNMSATGWVPSLLIGFWHGLIAPITFIMKGLATYYPDQLHVLPYIFWGPWEVYDGHLAGFVYNFGFCFGLLLPPALIWARPKVLM
jgi:hypothetical protein